jgi:GH35 family endo-1,4-beta-xylanase
MKPEVGIDDHKKGSEIKEIFTDALHRDLSSDENLLINKWVQNFNHEERATIINMMKELVNKHKRHD